MRVATRRTLGSPMNGDGDKGQRKLNTVLRTQGVHGFPYLVDYRTTDKHRQGSIISIQVPTNDLRYGDVLLAVHRETAGSGTFTWPAGWSELADSTADGSVDSATIGWRSVSFDSNETNRIGLSYSATLDAGVGVCWHFRNAGTPVVSSVVSANTAAMDPPNLAPGLGTLNFLWIALATCERNRTSWSYPTNYSLNQGNTGGGVGLTNTFAHLGWAMRELSASSENPGAFSVAEAEDSMSWTIAIPPA